MTEWTDADLALIQSLDAAGTPIDVIGRRLGRTPDEIEERLPIARARNGTLPVPTPVDRSAEQPWLGPDEEGDVPPAEDASDRSAWVHADPPVDDASAS
ncbi:MAG: hypothetical protein ACOY5R_22360 [Pseudomonadota bacterium]